MAAVVHEVTPPVWEVAVGVQRSTQMEVAIMVRAASRSEAEAVATSMVRNRLLAPEDREQLIIREMSASRFMVTDASAVQLNAFD